MNRIEGLLITLLTIFIYSPTMAGDMEYYKSYRTYKLADPVECNGDDIGRIQVSCKYIEVGSISGYLTVSQQKDPRWKKLSKYWETGYYIKFAGSACGRGSTEGAASKVAMDRAYVAVQSDITDFEEEKFDGLLASAGYRKFDGGWKCTSTPNTSNEREVASTPSGPLITAAPSEADTRAEEVERQRRANEIAHAKWREKTVTFVITNNDKYRLSLRFFKKTGSGGVWPGSGKNYVLSSSETYNLGCKSGDKVCYGAWRDHQTIYWGVGRDGREGCENCCMSCGGTANISLSHGGPDAYPQNQDSGGGAQILSDVIGAIGLGAAIYNGLNAGGGGGAPTGPSRRNSGISGN